jgi:hypothetical protein
MFILLHLFAGTLSEYSPEPAVYAQATYQYPGRSPALLQSLYPIVYTVDWASLSIVSRMSCGTVPKE